MRDHLFKDTTEGVSESAKGMSVVPIPPIPPV